ncbi:GTPase ObgE [Fusibacter tunisiensis]|uniref:GTPase Obg n=1 Tax=Fusibacter tunisiensis TaxID=1008308 RepID=A0ABS2MN48_9FIRM|nr:GTPase ObgE [Fusibacter tunisiensis]MBM7560747.1 GTP-binding protein [Fusibacter tunisiensis]
MFVDVARIHIKAGNGGNGRVSFRREKYVPDGGPDGGDGGNGGNIVAVVDSGMRTLMDFRYKTKYHALPGEDGGKKKMSGKAAEDLVIKVPEGTIIRDLDTGKVIADLKSTGDRVILAKGGRGGKGNQHFATPTRQAPTFAEKGINGVERTISLELKLLADVGLLGYPNVGKSTFLAATTKAKPKIANYHFTTLQPNLGVVEAVKGKSFVLADIPGLIEGAKEGVGLGLEFLRHVERTKILIHVVDISGLEGRDPYTDFCTINSEVFGYSERLSTRKQVVVANKMDLLYDETEYQAFKEKVEVDGYTVFPMSAATGEGIEAILNHVTMLLDTIEDEPLISEDDYLVEELDITDLNEINFFKDGDVYCVEGQFIERVLYSTDLSDIESLRRFQNVLKTKGVFDHLREMGIEDGDTVRIFDIEFEFYA